MALQPCHECSKQISTEAPTCPHCGIPMADRVHPPKIGDGQVQISENQFIDLLTNKTVALVEERRRKSYATILGLLGALGPTGVYTMLQSQVNSTVQSEVNAVQASLEADLEIEFDRRIDLLDDLLDQRIVNVESNVGAQIAVGNARVVEATASVPAQVQAAVQAKS